MVVADKQSCYVVTAWDNERVGFTPFKLRLVVASTYSQHAFLANDWLKFKKRDGFGKVTDI